jgi:hypothetical protein
MEVLDGYLDSSIHGIVFSGFSDWIDYSYRAL